MVCIFCQGKTQVINSRPQKRLNQVWRRRQCHNCHKIFTSEESAALDRSLKLVGVSNVVGSGIGAKTNGQIQPFVAEVLFLSIYNSLRHRPTALSDAAALSQGITGRLLLLVKNGQLERSDVVETTAAVLKRFDKAAATSYLAFHPLS